MSYLRALAIAPQSMQNQIEKKLREQYAYKILAQIDRHFLVAYAGRTLLNLDPKRTCTLGVDARNSGYQQSGNERLALLFGARIELVIGISVPLSRVRRIPDTGKKILNKLEKLSGYSAEDSEDVNRFNVRFDLSPSNEVSASKLIKQLIKILEKAAIPYRAILFSGESDGQALGSLSEEGLYIGPAAYVFASWEQEVMRAWRFDVTVNETEVLLDGNNVLEE